MQDAQQQLLTAQSESASIAKAKAMMEVETLRINQRIEILNNVATQATLLAGSSIGFLGGEALETVDDYEAVVHRIGKIIYASAGALALLSSLWVIIVSSHLIALTRDASLRKNILKASRLLDLGLKDVRGMHYFAMGCLLLACLSGALLNMSVGIDILISVIFTAFLVQVLCKLQFTSLQFYEEVELDIYDVAAIGSPLEIARNWLIPMYPTNLRRAKNMWTYLEKVHEDDDVFGSGADSHNRGQANSPPKNARFVRLSDEPS